MTQAAIDTPTCAAENRSGPASVGLWARLRCAAALVAGLRRHDFRAARTFMAARFGDCSPPRRSWRFTVWALDQMFRVIPAAMQGVSIDRPVSRVPMWLADGNPLANHPWRDAPDTRLPAEADTVVIGAGFTGGALAYHWARQAPHQRLLAILEMDDPASGSSGRNEGLVVMGRYYAMVEGTVARHLDRVRRDLSPRQRERLAGQFAAAYCRAAYKNAELIERTIRSEGFDCDYAREGWVQARDAQEQEALAESVRKGHAAGLDDWTQINPDDVLQRTGMQVRHNAGFSVAAASFHPAKWVWSLVTAAIAGPNVRLFTRTRVMRVEDAGEWYLVHTSRGAIRARHVVNATESYTPLLHPQFHDVLRPTQTQAACGDGGPPAMKPHVGISASWFFCGRHGTKVLTGSDATRVPDQEAGRNQPSRFLTKFLLGEMKRYFGPFRFHLTHEWSGTVSYTPDEFPVVGLMDGKRQYIIGGAAGSGTAVSFNAARAIVARILGLAGQDDDYPGEYFAPSRLLDPEHHRWPAIDEEPDD